MLPLTVLETLKFFVPGLPAPGGSKKFVGVSKKTGRAILVDDADKRNKDWRSVVCLAGHQALLRHHGMIFDGPLRLSVIFVMPRPRDHYRTNGQLKANAPALHTKKPDRTKLLRSTEDALKNVIWHDDNQVVDGQISKVYTGVIPGLDAPGALVIVERVTLNQAAILGDLALAKEG
ncbi:MAG: RusA family crossover junction endodeoxyribonuclease [Bacteroidota bacterium]